MKTVKLNKSQHDRKRFDCSVEALNNYLKVMASQQSDKDNTRTFVLEDDNNPSYIIGFYTLTMVPIDVGALPDKLQKKHQSASSGGLIARLAVDNRYKGNGYGKWLLIDGLKKLVLASDYVAFPIVVVDAKDGAKEFYENFGFQVFLNEKNKLFIPITDIRGSIK